MYNGTGVDIDVSVGVGTGVVVGVELGAAVGIQVGEGNGVDDGSGESGVDMGDVEGEYRLQAAKDTIKTSATLSKGRFLLIVHPLSFPTPTPISGNVR